MVKLAVDQFWNKHKIFKKHQKIVIPVHMFLVCHVLPTTTDKQGLDIFFEGIFVGIFVGILNESNP